MSDGYNFEQLKAAILSMSESKDWEIARKEWHLVSIYDETEPDTCLCGHFPIIEICEIENRITGRRTDVGNVCIQRFMGFRSDLIFDGLKRIQKDEEKALNADAIAFFRERGVITAWEYGFLENTKRKRKLTHNQLTTRININRKVLAALKKRPLR